MKNNADQLAIKKKNRKNVSFGVIVINSTFNNTIITISDPTGAVIAWSSCGSQGFKGSRKSTPYAAQVASDHAVKIAMMHGLKTAIIKVKGPGNGRESAIRAISNLGINVTEIRDETPVPHNGCRPPKRRRV